MSHDLTEGILGAPSLDSVTDSNEALLRLERSVVSFTANNVALQPHFAYGQLNQEDYQLAHVLHLANHFSAIDS